MQQATSTIVKTPGPRFEPGRVRAATAVDLDDVNRVVECAIAGWGLPERVRRLALPTFRYTRVDLDHMTIRMEIEPAGRARGVVAWESASASDSGRDGAAFELHGLYVTPGAQRRGTGTRLLALALAHAAQSGHAGVSVRAWREAEGFFRARGFTPVGDPAAYPRRLWRAVS